MANGQAAAPSIPQAAWTYASGRIAALEGQLLTAEALDRLAGAETPAAAASALAESPLRSAAAAASAGEAATAVAAHYSALVASLEAGCPSRALFELVSLPARYRALKERSRRELAGAAAAELGLETVLQLLGGDFAPDGVAADALRLAGAALAESEPPSAGLALDLCLDSARLAEAPELAAALGDDEVTAHVSAETAVRSVLAVWRARLLCEGGGAPELERWLPRLFLRGALADAVAARLWPLPLAAWAERLAEALDCRTLAEAFGAGEADRLDAWEKAAFDWLSARARELRRQTFGAGRVRGFAWAMEVEERNVRLALVGRLRGVRPDAVRELLWEGAA